MSDEVREILLRAEMVAVGLGIIIGGIKIFSMIKHKGKKK